MGIFSFQKHKVYVIISLVKHILHIGVEHAQNRPGKRLKSVFRFLESLKVFKLDKLVSSLRCSKPTARLKLKQWKAYTSYNKNSRYYAMPTVPRFDENGLWHYENLRFDSFSCVH